jgi:hypothetical protein
VREVIEVPVVRARVVHYRVMAHWCGVCGKRVVAPLPLCGEVAGRRRAGLGLMSLVCYLKVVCRLTVRRIAELLQSLYGLHLSLGEIADLLHGSARRGSSEYEQLREEIRGSPYVHADETGWREDGVNGYLWSFSAPGVRYFVHDRSRSHEVPKRVLGEAYPGVLATDFYGAYNYHLGPHQRCWVHLLRDLKALREKHPADAGVAAWCAAVEEIYGEAKAFASPKARERSRKRQRLQQRAVEIAMPYAKTTQPQAVLAERLLRFEPELFTFVEHPEVPSDNNAAERAIRPMVIARKVSGGTRSEQGSRTYTILASLFATWQERGLDPLLACRRLLANEPPQSS